jgi:hypothetical protein
MNSFDTFGDFTTPWGIARQKWAQESGEQGGWKLPGQTDDAHRPQRESLLCYAIAVMCSGIRQSKRSGARAASVFLILWACLSASYLPAGNPSSEDAAGPSSTLLAPWSSSSEVLTRNRQNAPTTLTESPAYAPHEVVAIDLREQRSASTDSGCLFRAAHYFPTVYQRPPPSFQS